MTNETSAERRGRIAEIATRAAEDAARAGRPDMATIHARNAAAAGGGPEAARRIQDAARETRA